MTPLLLCAATNYPVNFALDLPPLPQPAFSWALLVLAFWLGYRVGRGPGQV